jgi:DNA-directed RNA polymerase specialized sigma24 family protein
MDQTTEELENTVLQFRSDNKEAYFAIVKERSGALYYFINEFVHDNQAIQQITDESFELLWHHRKSFHSYQTIKSHLYRSAFYFALLHLIRIDSVPRDKEQWKQRYRLLCKMAPFYTTKAEGLSTISNNFIPPAPP